MNRIKKGFAAFLVAAFLFGVGGAAHAVIGVPDDVPGSTLLFPFFKINPNRTASDTQDTLLVVTNTAGATTNSTTNSNSLNASGVAPNIAVHFTVWSSASVHVYDFSVILTPHDVFSCSLYDLIVGLTGCKNDSSGATVAPAPAGVASLLQTTIDNKTILTGYVTADLVYAPTSLFPGEAGYPFVYGNILVGHLYLVNLINGSSTGFNAVSLESANPCYGHPAVQLGSGGGLGFYRTRCRQEQGVGSCAPTVPPVTTPLTCSTPIQLGTQYGDNTERIDGPNGDAAQTGDGLTGPAGSDSPLSLIVRYFSESDISARSELWSWRDRVPPTNNLNVSVYDEEENVHSIGFVISNEVSFDLTANIITPGAVGGWFRVKYLCATFNSCLSNHFYVYSTDLSDDTATGAKVLDPPIQSVAYSVQFANSQDASLRWDAAFPAHRQYSNYITPGASE
jgi:hypothetical protein